MYGSMITASRKNDAVIAVCQNNSTKQIEIQKVNPAAAELTGYGKSELEGKLFTDILPDNIKETLDSYVEFDNSFNDLAHVVNRAMKFQILTRDGDVLPIGIRAFHVPGASQNPCFELLIRDISLQEEMKKIREQLQADKQNADIDPDTGLPSIDFMAQYMEAVRSFLETHRIDATFALMELSVYDMINQNYGEDAANEAVSTVGERFRAVCRAEDAIAYLNDGIFGVLLFDCSGVNAKSVFNRITNKIANPAIRIRGHGELNLNTYVAYHQMRGDEPVEDVVNYCAEQLANR